MIHDGKITDIKPGLVVIEVPYDNWEELTRKKFSSALVQFVDGRTISTQQRNAIYSFITLIAECVGDDTDSMKQTLKTDFAEKNPELMLDADEPFSLSDCSMTVASMFIDYLLDMMFGWGIVGDEISEHVKSIDRYTYICTLHKRCLVCGNHADLHHVDHVGTGRDRTEIIHTGMIVMPLCRKHHTECHTIGQKTFDSKYHVEPVRLNNELCDKYDLRKETENEQDLLNRKTH